MALYVAARPSDPKSQRMTRVVEAIWDLCGEVIGFIYWHARRVL
jgi:hypothetical protein